MLYYLAVVLYVIVCLFLIIVVLLQPGKGDGMGSAFGGSSTGSVFGGRGASTVLTKMTTGAAVLFMLLSIVLAKFSADSSSVDANAANALPGATAPATAGGEQPANKPADKPADAPKPADKPAPAATKTND